MVKDGLINKECLKCFKREENNCEEERSCTPAFEVMATPFNTGPSDCENDSKDLEKRQASSEHSKNLKQIMS